MLNFTTTFHACSYMHFIIAFTCANSTHYIYITQTQPDEIDDQSLVCIPSILHLELRMLCHAFIWYLYCTLHSLIRLC
jgi:hypothetical protein